MVMRMLGRIGRDSQQRSEKFTYPTPTWRSKVRSSSTFREGYFLTTPDWSDQGGGERKSGVDGEKKGRKWGQKYPGRLVPILIVTLRTERAGRTKGTTKR